MNYIVTRDDGVKDTEFPTYVRLLRQSGLDLGNLPRVREPGTGRRWLNVWESRGSAEEFANRLRANTGADGWKIVETDAPPSEGPLGPVMIQLARRSDGLLFALETLSGAMLRSAFPGTTPPSTTIFLGTEQWNDFQKSHGDLGALVRELAPALTGLKNGDLDELGYVVLDADDARTWVSVPPAQLSGCTN